MIKDDQLFHQRQIFIKIAKPILIIPIMADLNRPQMDNFQFMVLMFDDNIIMSMPDLNNGYYSPPVIDL